MTETEQKPITKPVKVLQASDVVSGLMKVLYNGDKSTRAVATTMIEMALYRYAGRIVGEHMSISQLTGSGNEVRLIVEKERGKKIEEAMGVGIVSQTDNGLRKKQTYATAMKDGLVNTAICYASQVLLENMGGDQDFLDYIKSWNPFDPINKE